MLCVLIRKNIAKISCLVEKKGDHSTVFIVCFFLGGNGGIIDILIQVNS